MGLFDSKAPSKEEQEAAKARLAERAKKLRSTGSKADVLNRSPVFKDYPEASKGNLHRGKK